MSELQITLRNGRTIVADVTDWWWDEVRPPAPAAGETFTFAGPYRRLTWNSAEGSARQLVYVDDAAIVSIVAQEIVTPVVAA